MSHLTCKKRPPLVQIKGYIYLSQLDITARQVFAVVYRQSVAERLKLYGISSRFGRLSLFVQVISLNKH